MLSRSHSSLALFLLVWTGASLIAYSRTSQDPTPGVERPQTVPYRAPEQMPSPRLLTRIEPVYPAEAYNRQIQGWVQIQIIINEKGEVWVAKVLSGHPLLRDAALAAVRRWRYAPSLMDGSPVPVITTVRVNIQMGRQKSKCGAEPPRREPIRTGARVQESKLLHKVEPVYPPGVAGKGTIILQVTINESGVVYEAQVLRGPEEFRAAALAAVCQWRYAPTYLDLNGNSVPVPVIATVTLAFGNSK